MAFSEVFSPGSWWQILIGKAVGTKQAMYANSAIEDNVTEGSTSVRDTFKVRQVLANGTVCLRSWRTVPCVL